MYLRAYKFCDTEFLDQELQYTKNVFIKHSYSEQFIDKAHTKARRIFYILKEKRPFANEHETLLVLPPNIR